MAFPVALVRPKRLGQSNIRIWRPSKVATCKLPPVFSPCVRGWQRDVISMQKLPAVRLALGLFLLTGPALRAAEIGPLGPPGLDTSRFPAPDRRVAPVVSDRWRAEDERERVGEASRVMAWMDIKPGMTVADVGAGSGYYTMQLAAQVGPTGRVLAQDVMLNYLVQLRTRVTRAGLDNVSVGLGDPGDPRLPAQSTDAVVMVHMYHEIQQPFALLANLIPALKPGARLGIVDVDDATERHGTPRATLECELTASGYKPVLFHWLLIQPPRSEYLAVFEPPAVAVAPDTIRDCAALPSAR